MSDGGANVDITTDVFKESSRVSLSESDRLSFAKWVLFWLAVICAGVFTAYAYAPTNPAIKEIFEVVKIGALPLVTLVISFYFPNGSNK